MKKINEEKAFKIILSAVGILVGVVIIFIALRDNYYNLYRCEHVKQKIYGGEAYTGIQNAGAETANNVSMLYNLIQYTSKIFLIVLGILIILHYAEKLFENIKKLKE